jgi:hypothetical protein
MNTPTKTSNLRLIVNNLVAETANHLERYNESSHARLVLAGLQSNKQARSLLCLIAAYDRADRASVRQIAGVPLKRFQSTWASLQMCGAIIPDPDLMGRVDDLADLYTQLENAAPQWVHKTYEEQRAYVIEKWRNLAGEKLSPAITTLLKEELTTLN